LWAQRLRNDETKILLKTLIGMQKMKKKYLKFCVAQQSRNVAHSRCAKKIRQVYAGDSTGQRIE
jgi:hypothetical protein